jgi:hypothetical protein
VKVKRWLGAGLGLILLGQAACTAPEETTDPPPSVNEYAASDVDPQVFSDAVDGVFMLPGDSKARTRRVIAAITSIGNVDCGGQPFPDLDGTFDRFDQGLYPDLKLIAEKGLSDDGPDYRSLYLVPEYGQIPANGDLSQRCQVKSLPSLDAWNDLMVDWGTVTDEVVTSAEMAPVNKSTKECLASKSGIDIDEGIPNESVPTSRYVLKVDGAMMRSSATPGDETWKAAEKRYSDIYVECAGDYVNKMIELLTPKRDELVERNRELFNQFASELTAAGYLP